jgi:MoxR-like ATPase
MMKLSVAYPSREEERLILDRMASTNSNPHAGVVVGPGDILAVRALVDSIYMDEKIKEYIIDLVLATRDPQAFKLDLAPFIRYGASPRATLYLTVAAKAHAFISGRGYVTPQDVKSIGADVLRHRVIISYEAEAEDLTSDDIVQRVFDGVPVP